MEIREHEQIILSDFEAQYQVILGNISTANTDLEKALDQKKSLENELASLVVSVSEKKRDLDTIENQLSSIKRSLETKEKKLKERELELEKEKDLFDEEVYLKNTALKEKEISVDYAVSDKIKELDKLIDIEKNIKSSIDKLEQTKTFLSSSIKELDKEMFEKSEKYIKAKTDSENTIKQLNQNIKDLNKELEKTKKLVDKEKEKILMPMQVIKEERRVFDKEKRNFEILVTRFKKEFKKLYPNQELKL